MSASIVSASEDPEVKQRNAANGYNTLEYFKCYFRYDFWGPLLNEFDDDQDDPSPSSFDAIQSAPSSVQLNAAVAERM